SPMKTLWFLLLIALPALGASLDLDYRGKRAKTVASAAVTSQGAADLRVFEPHESREVTYRAVPLNPLLDTHLGKHWRERDVLVFRCRDGYQAAIETERFLKNKAWLAFARNGSE